MHKIVLVLAGILCLLQSCKKDDSSGTASATSSSRTLIAAPAGFSFPHTYLQTNRTTLFHLWVNGIDRSSQSNPQTLFGNVDELRGVNIKLLDKTTLLLLDPEGINDPDTGTYFFTKDSLFVIEPGLTDTFAFAQGGYNGFDIAYTNYLIIENDRAGGRRARGNTFYGVRTYNDMLKLAAKYGIEKPDSLAAYTVSISLQ